MGVVVISHNLADVFEVADRIFVLRLGRKAADIAADEASQEEVVAAITGAEFGGNGQHQRGRAHRRSRNERERRRRGRRSHRRRGGRTAPRLDLLRRFVAGDLAELRVVLVLALIWAIFYAAGGPLPQLGQPDQPGPADHGGRAGLGRRGARAAAGRDRPVGRRGERAVRGDHGRAEREEGLVALPGDRRRPCWPARRSACSRASWFTRFGIPSFVVTLAGLLAWQGAQLEVLGETGTMNITDPKITGLTSTFYSDTVGWIVAILSRSRPPRRSRCWGAGAALRQGIKAPPLGLGGAADRDWCRWRCWWRSGCSTTTGACRWRR